MKKLPVLSLFLFFLCSNLFAESSFEIFKHNGKTLLKFVSKETEVREYDLQGNLIAEVTPFKNTKYEYDSMGNQIYAFESDSLGGSNEIFREFNEDNNLIYEKGSASGEYIFKYDENKNLISKKKLVNDTVVFEFTYTYDSNNNLIKTEYSNGFALNYKYDENNNLIYYYDSNSNEYFKEYDESNNLIYEKCGLSQETFYDYDSNGNLIHKKNKSDFSFSEEWFEYNSEGKKIYSKKSNGTEKWFVYQIIGDIETTTIYTKSESFFENYAGPVVLFSIVFVFLIVFIISLKRKDWKLFNNFFIPIYIIGFLGSVALFFYNLYYNEGEDFLLGNEITALAIPAFFFGLAKLFRTRFRKARKSSLRRVKNENQDLIAGAFENDLKSEKKLLQALNHYNVEEYDKSIKILEKLSQECRITKDRHILDLFLAMNYKQIGETEKAVNLYESLIVVGNANGRIYSNLGSIYVQQGNFERGIELCKKAAIFDSKNPIPYYNVACGYFKDGDYDSAIQWAKNTLEVKNDYQEGIALLYLIYTILDNQEEIKKYEQKAIANGIKKSQLKRMVKRYL